MKDRDLKKTGCVGKRKLGVGGAVALGRSRYIASRKQNDAKKNTQPIKNTFCKTKK